MRGEVLGVERRRCWDDEVKLAIMSAVDVGGATVTQVPRRHDVTRQQIFAWRHELKRKGLWSPDAGALFLPAGMVPAMELRVVELRQKPSGGAVFAFRGHKEDQLKLLYWDGQGFCLYDKVLERGRFPCPNASSGAVRLTSAPLAMLWEGIDWRRPDWGAPPARVG